MLEIFLTPPRTLSPIPGISVQHPAGMSTYGGSVETLDRLRHFVKKSGKKQKAIAEDAGMTAQRLSKILRGETELKVADLIDIARALAVDPARIVSDEETFVPITDLRDAHDAARRAAAILGAHITPDVQQTSVVSLRKAEPKRTAQPIRAAASSNVELFPEIEKKRKTIPRDAWNRKARRIARAIGDSMSGPDGIDDGQLVYVKPTRNKRAADGEIVVIRVEDAIYLKRMRVSGRMVYLESINPRYDTIEVDTRETQPELIGIVVAKK